jgi:hypothetical protein
MLKRIDALREGEDLVFHLTLARDATPTELPLAGTPWRLAVDLAPRSAAAPPEAKPEYIPGDLPIPTKLAGEDVADNSAAPDPAQAHAVLAYFYMNRGDTANANAQAYAYQQLTGAILDLSARPAVAATQSSPAKTPQSFLPKKLPKLILPTPVLWLIIFGGGLLGGLFLNKLRGGIHPPRLNLHLPKFKKRVRAKPLESELVDDLEALDSAVAQEPHRQAAPPPPPAPELVPEPVMEEEKEVRESLMDRRVRRVLELSREGRSVTDIAEELQMGQDEVKLILDLNQQ